MAFNSHGISAQPDADSMYTQEVEEPVEAIMSQIDEAMKKDERDYMDTLVK